MNHETLTAASLRDDSCVERPSGSPELIHAQRILVADDDALIRQLVATALAADGEQAWEALHHDHYDLLVTDNEMPRLAGIKLIEWIRNEGMSLPVIMASSSFSVDQARKDSRLQIAAVLPKPFDLLEFLDTVRHALQPAGESAAAPGTFCQLHPISPLIHQQN